MDGCSVCALTRTEALRNVVINLYLLRSFFFFLRSPPPSLDGFHAVTRPPSSAAPPAQCCTHCCVTASLLRRRPDRLSMAFDRDAGCRVTAGHLGASTLLLRCTPFPSDHAPHRDDLHAWPHIAFTGRHDQHARTGWGGRARAMTVGLRGQGASAAWRLRVSCALARPARVGRRHARARSAICHPHHVGRAAASCADRREEHGQEHGAGTDVPAPPLGCRLPAATTPSAAPRQRSAGTAPKKKSFGWRVACSTSRSGTQSVAAPAWQVR